MILAVLLFQSNPVALISTNSRNAATGGSNREQRSKTVGQIFRWHHATIPCGFLPGEFGSMDTFPLRMGPAPLIEFTTLLRMQGIYIGPTDPCIRMES